MKRKILLATSFLLALSLSFCFSNYSFAAKKKNQGAQTLVVLSNDGETQVYGSVLSPREDEVNVFLSKTILTKVRKVGLENLNINLTSSLDSTRTYGIPSDVLTIKRKVLNKTAGKYLVISLFNLTTPSGITISPSSLPNDTYRLRIQGKELDATTDSFIYNTPALIVGSVDSSRTGLVDVENLSGDKISDKTVATNLNGTFFTEVRADKIISKTKARKIFREQVNDNQTAADTTNNGSTEGDVVEEIHTGVVHIAADKDLYKITPLTNNPDSNAALTQKPLVVDESSTLTANIAIENAKQGNEELATETAKGIADNLKSNENDKSNEDITFEGGKDFECDIGNIDQFANRCSENEDDLAVVGKAFREFIAKANCNFSEFKLIKTIIPKLPEDANIFIGRGYCEINQESDENKPCEAYKEVLHRPEYEKDGGIPPCPPPNCTQFQNIKCFKPQDFCGGALPQEGLPPTGLTQGCRGPQCQGPIQQSCVHKPMRDLYCARIGVDIKAEECKDVGDFVGPAQFKPNWTIVKNSKGNDYCVPSNIPKPQYPLGYTGPLPPSTPEEIAEECEVNACHNQCSVKFGFNHGPIPPGSIYPGSPLEAASQGLSNCHFACDADAGKIADCGNPLSKYFKKDCCNTNTFGPVLYTQSSYLAQTFSPGFPQGGFGSGSFGGGNFGGFGHGPIPPDVRGCLCLDPNNFNEKGFVKEDAQNVCKNSCPKGYEKDPNSDSCLQICPEGAVRDPGGICRKKCPEGSFDDGTGYCRCPEGQIVGKSGKCEPNGCPEYCKNFINATSIAVMPPECKGCFGGGGPASCPPGQILIEEQVFCVTAPCPTAKRCACPDRSNPGPNGQCGQNNICGNSNMYPNPNYTPGSNQAQCICPDGLPYWETTYNPTPGSGGGRCVAHCSNGDPPANTSTNYLSKSPIPCSSGPNTRPCTAGEGPSNGCYCFGSGYTGPDGKCQCSGSQQYNGGGCGTSTSHVCAIGEAATTSNPCYCASGATFTGPSGTGTCQCPSGSSQSYSPASGCGTSTSNYCSPGITIGTNSCTCNPGGGAYNSNGYCTCPPNSGSYTKETGCASTSRACNAGEGPSNGCYCFGTGFTGTDGKCQCSGGVQYTGGGCGTSSTNYCAAGTGPSSTNNCTCAPGATVVNGTCQCPNNNTPAYTPPAGCGSSTTRPCNAGEGPSNGCYCFGGGFTGSNGQCQCSGGITYTGAGCGTSQNYNCAAGTGPSSTNNCTCGPGATIVSGICQCPNNNTPAYTPAGCGTSTSSHVCAAGEAATTTNPCYCAGGATFTGPSGTGTCQCPNNNTPAYTAAGCGSTASHTCAPGEVPTASSPCTCATGASFGTGNTCQCPSGQTYYVSGCQQQCTGGQILDPSTNTCRCPNNQVLTNGACQCPSGYVVDPNSSTNCIVQQTVTLNSASFTGNNLTLNYSKSGFSECVLLVGSANTILHNGVNAYGLLCSQSGGSVTTALSNFNNITNGYSVKLCKGNGTDVNTNTNLYSPNLCSAPIPVTTSDTITLTSVVRNSSGDLTVTYSKSFSDCVGIRQNDINGLRVTSQNQFCGTSGTETVTAANLKSTVSVGSQVVLCNDISRLCSSPVAITGQ